MAATKAGDIGSVLDLMTDDVVFMVPGRVPFGKQEFAAMSGSHQGLRIDGNAESPIARGVERRLGNCAKPIIESWCALPAVSHPTQPAARAGGRVRASSAMTIARSFPTNPGALRPGIAG